ncbi:hypothetical protein K1T71_003759 [Dendrolimus kikuchii]|uniref:Uncharacterized protein n=1 Tax=Dendrolimus kikuchii TaxID=765133 RepID=A0ACC1D909_9NEOP|nr:hypothetical protein K1T71_003759 [Dendrolimus kikuchii]
MYNLDGKNVFITGAANGIGASVVRDCLREGVKFIAFLDIDETAGKALEKELQAQYGEAKVKFLKCDVSKEAQLFTAFDTVFKDHGYIDVVINNAGLADESTPRAIRTQIEVNYLALVNGTIKAIEFMHKNKGGHGGTVINISSIAALCQISPALFVYFGTKSAVLQFSNCIGKEEYYTLTGVRVLTICFGATETDILKQFNTFDDDANVILKNLPSKYPMQTTEFAGKELVEAFKKGETGSTWLINNKPAQDITETIQKAYKMLSDLILPSFE